MKIFNRFLPGAIFVIVVLFFFRAVFLEGKLPIPSDTIIGLYHPFRDYYAKTYPNGIPFKNFLITDPVRQQYPWRELAISLEKKFQLPLWNPYNFGGAPLLANLQSGAFYPLNFLFFLLPFSTAWSLTIILQVFLAGLFLYLYLSSIKLNPWATVLGALVFSFSGFSVAWMEWNTIFHVALWLPLILLSIDKIFSNHRHSGKQSASRIWWGFWTSSPRSRFGEAGQNDNKNVILWSFIFLFSVTSSFFAGHLQTFFYLLIVVVVHFFLRWLKFGKEKKTLLLFFILALVFVLITAIQWLPTAQFISESAREIDKLDWQKEGWFIPWEHLIQFVAPDFFGNPTTLNYWGVWNYGELVGYAGIFPLIMAIFAIFFRRDKKTLCFIGMFFLSLFFALPTFLAMAPYVFHIPFIATAQPTRLLFLTDFSLAILSALGFDYFLRQKNNILFPLGFLGLVFIGLWLFVFFGNGAFPNISSEHLFVAKNNLLLPTGIFIAIACLLLLLRFVSKLNKLFMIAIYMFLIGITCFDFLRFGEKFTPFTQNQYLFPQTKTLSFLQENLGNYRIMTTDNRILPPNFSIMYRLQTVDGYDPLYLLRYGELIAASERGKPDINPPFGFNRIITPNNYESKIIDLLGVKYVLSLSNISSDKLKKVFQEGQTRIYDNTNVIPRAFFVKNIYAIVHKGDKQKVIDTLFKPDLDLKSQAIVEYELPKEILIDLAYGPEFEWSVGKASISYYSENNVKIKTENNGEGFLVFTDTFYPIWHATIDGKETKIYRTDYNFRGVFVPKGKRVVEFYTKLF